MLKIGLCGGMGAGKTIVGKLLDEFGIPCISSDELARVAVEKGNKCLEELTEYFGKKIIYPDGTLNRSVLAAIAFSSPENSEMLNKITHPYITELLNQRILTLETDSKAVFIDAPLLFESGLDREFDFNVAVVADTDIRVSRAIMRDGISAEQALARIGKQKSNEFLIENCDYYIENNVSLDKLREKVEMLLQKLGVI
ncbi:MAG: dephospho-CoA kinase [Clostridiales bacterium GWF2_38_85]|nr:MAG: dephospho-CoA kinase [Clostridiales bacterium GWF2_38_85]HBL83812.1 dephospho-CoA kinase [Clostridiales bacterium]